MVPFSFRRKKGANYVCQSREWLVLVADLALRKCHGKVVSMVANKYYRTVHVHTISKGLSECMVIHGASSASILTCQSTGSVLQAVVVPASNFVSNIFDACWCE
jgi:hypothetical protein